MIGAFSRPARAPVPVQQQPPVTPPQLPAAQPGPVPVGYANPQMVAPQANDGTFQKILEALAQSRIGQYRRKS